MKIKTALRPKRLARRLAAIAALSASAIALVPAAAQAYEARVYEHSGRTDTGITVQGGHRVEIVADPTQKIWSGWWFHSSNGPAGYGTANEHSPMPGQKAFSLVARIGTQYEYIGNGRVFYANSTGELTLFVNDDTPGNGNGYFGIESIRIYSPPW